MQPSSAHQPLQEIQNNISIQILRILSRHNGFYESLDVKPVLDFRLKDTILPDWRVMTERKKAHDSSSCVSVQQSVGSSPGCDTSVLKQIT